MTILPGIRGIHRPALGQVVSQDLHLARLPRLSRGGNRELDGGTIAEDDPVGEIASVRQVVHRQDVVAGIRGDESDEGIDTIMRGHPSLQLGALAACRRS